MGHPAEVVNRYSGLSLDEIRQHMNEALEPRGHFQDAWEEEEEHKASRERACVVKLLEALDGATLHGNLAPMNPQRYSAEDVLCAFKSILKDFDEGRAL